jgi:hypothetical protein
MKLMTIAATFLVAFPTLYSAQDSPLPLAEERRELAEIRVLLGADRDYAGAKARLAVLATALGASTDVEAAALAAEVERLVQEVRRALGEAVPAAFANASQDKIDAAVHAALERGDFEFIGQLGSRAGPALAAVIEAAPDAFTGNPENDPLLHLLRLDARRADALLARMLPYDGFLWRKRVVRTFDKSDPWSDQTLWSTHLPPRWEGPGILHTLEKLAVDSEVGNDALRMLGQLAARGADDEVFLSVAEQALRDRDKVRRDFAKGSVRLQPIEAVRGLLEGLIAESDVDLRVFAASILSQHGSRALLARADDPDRVVRLWVADLVGKGAADGLDDEEARALSRLLVDEDAEVRRRALGVLDGLRREKRVTVAQNPSGKTREFRREEYTDPLPEEVYRAALARADAAGRKRLVQIAALLPAPLCFELLEALAADPARDVLERVVSSLDELPSWSDPDAVLRVHSALRANPAAHPFLEHARSELTEITSSRAGLVALARWLLAHPEVEIADVKIDWPAIASADPAVFADYATQRFARDPEHFGDRLQTVDPAALLRLAQDAEHPLPLRLVALGRAASRLSHTAEVNAEARAAAERLLADPGWGALEQDTWGWLESELSNLVGRLPAEHRNPVLLALIANDRIPDWLKPGALGRFERHLPGAVEIARSILARWFTEPPEDDASVGNDARQRIEAVRRALATMASEPELRDDALLAAATRAPYYDQTAWDTIGRMRDPAFLPLIRAALEEQVTSPVLSALTGYMDDEAAELLLLAAARTPSVELRDQALAHLEKIREYQESRERWATRKVKTATRAQVIAELVTQLDADSDDVKVQAIRALATWEAGEAMPRLIGLTTSGSQAVAAAARAALERLNAPKDG